MKVLISGGGTAGHINPAIAIGTRLKAMGADVMYIGSDGSLEQKLYSRTGCPYLQFTSKGLDRKHLLRNFNILATDCKAFFQIQKAVKEFGPDVGVSTGGYISALSMYALNLQNIPFLIHEQNAYPGLTTKLLSRWAKKYAVAFGEAIPYLKYKDRATVTGNPIRNDFLSVNRESARQLLGIAPDENVVLSFGGSLGALQLNNAMAELIPMAQKDGITLLIGTGSRYYEQFLSRTASYKIDNKKIRILQYIDHMPAYLAACDVAITRAGAMTVSELCAAGTPAILIPSPNVTANHQDKNAEAMVEAGAAIKIPESLLTSERLYQTVSELIKNPDKLERMREDSKKNAITDADKRIASLVTQIALKQ